MDPDQVIPDIVNGVTSERFLQQATISAICTMVPGSTGVKILAGAAGFNISGVALSLRDLDYDLNAYLDQEGYEDVQDMIMSTVVDIGLQAGVSYGIFKGTSALKGKLKEYRSGKRASGAGLDKKLMNELAESGVKYNADDVVMITKNSDGELLWLEKGTDSSGLKHIIDGKSTNFADRGITDIPKFLEETLNTKPVRVGSNSRGKYAEFIINGKEYTVAYGTNGYIVSFYPSGN